MDLDVVTLSRIQFAMTIMFHYLFPPLTIGMGVVLVYLEARYLWTKEVIYETAAKFWTQLFAVSFAMGVATGIVMEFQFGTNWAAYSRFVGDVFGSALAAEGIFAFFLESGFLAVLVFGWDKVSPRFHFIATLFVAVGSMFSAVWIIVANSWQQTPQGHHIVQMMRDGEPWFDEAGRAVVRAEIVDFRSVVFNPSTVDRLTHTLIGAFILGALFVMSVSAFYLLKRKHEEFARRSFSGALLLGTIFSLAQAVSGHSNARMVAAQQPAKLAAFEGHFQTGPANLSLIGIPDEEAAKTHLNVAIPGFLSFLIHGDAAKPVIGLDKIPREYWPPVLLSFLSYHVMLGIGVFLIVLTLSACWFHWRGTLFQKRWLLWVFVFAVLPGFIANEAGWVAAEVGRQPWVVHPRVHRDAAGQVQFDQAGFVRYQLEEGLLTKDGVSESVVGGQVLASIVMFSVIYVLLFSIWVFVLNTKIQKGPVPVVLGQRTTAKGFAHAAAERAGRRASMSEAKSRNQHSGDLPEGEGRAG